MTENIFLLGTMIFVLFEIEFYRMRLWKSCIENILDSQEWIWQYIFVINIYTTYDLDFQDLHLK